MNKTLNDIQASGGALNDQQVMELVAGSKFTNILTKRSFGRMKVVTPAAGGFTCTTQFEVEAPFGAVRIGIPNLHTAAIAGVKVQVAVGNAWAGAGHWELPTTPAGGTWINVTFNGAASGSLAARIDANNASITYTDLIPLRSLVRADGGRPILAVRIQYPDGAIVTCPGNDFYGWRTFTTSGRPMRASSQGVLGIDTPANYTTTTSVDTNVCVPVVEYHTDAPGRQVMLLGDSTVEGSGASSARAWGAVQRAITEVSTQDKPIEYYNMALHGGGNGAFVPGLNYAFPVVRPSVIFAAPLSVNDIAVGGMNYLAWNGWKNAMDNIVDKKVETYIMGTLPFNAAFRDVNANDVHRRDLNAFMSKMLNVTYVEGYVEAFSGPLDGDGQTTIISGLSGDNVHPNDVGYTALKETVKPYVEALV